MPPPQDQPHRKSTVSHHGRAADEKTTAAGEPASSPDGTLVQGENSRQSAVRKSSAGSAPEAPPGYELLGELGRGGMGVVFKARQVKLDRVVALKMVLSGEWAGAAELARFEAEARAVAALQHPNIVAVYETGEVNGKPYLALEFCPGGTLDSLTADGPLDPERAAEITHQLAKAVAAAHKRDIVHRDLKPGNVLLDDEGTPKITDFGLAKRVGKADGVTVTGAVVGTPAYMAPEQAQGKKKVGPPADVYALGVILYELLTGRPPFRADSVFDTLQKVVHDDPTPPRRLRKNIPLDLETVVLKCLEKDPGKRYPTAKEMAGDLKRFLAGEPVGARRVGRGEKAGRWLKKNKLAAGFTAVSVLLLAVVVVLAARPGRPKAPPQTDSVPPALAGPTPEPQPEPAGPKEATAADVLAMVEELDRTDPNWRIEQIDAARRKVPPAENSAPLIDAAHDALGPYEAFGPRLDRFLKANDSLPPTANLPPEFWLTREPGAVRLNKARAAARQVADRPRGRFQINWGRDYFSVLLPHADRTRRVVAFLQWDAVTEASGGEIDQALASCRACVHAGAALDGEPLSIIQLVRIACGTVGIRSAERVLALGVASSDEPLVALTPALRAEEAANLLLTAARAERGGMHQIFTSAAAGDLPNPDAMDKELVEAIKKLPKGDAARTNHIWAVRHLTKMVEIAKLPPHQQAPLIKEWGAAVRFTAPTGAKTMMPAMNKIGDACRRYTAHVRAAIAALACERYRMKHGQWPGKLDDVVPEFLPAVPLDPEDGRPLRFRRLPDGLVVYGIGTNGKDDGGSSEKPDPDSPWNDMVFRLWDAERRGK